MIRATVGDEGYWNKWSKFSFHAVSRIESQLKLPSKNPSYRPQYAFNLTQEYSRLILRRYSRGDAVPELSENFLHLLESWELSNKLADEVCKKESLESCRNWSFDLASINHYNWCFWLVGLALSLNIPDDQWQRLLALVASEGEDELLDKVISSRQINRKIGKGLLHKKPYGRLLTAIESPKENQAVLMLEFVDNWYEELKRKGKDELWWYSYGDPEKHPLEKGSYFGRWCVEAVAAVKAFGLDDSLCLGHDHYPGDLIRPNTHINLKKRTNLITRLLDKIAIK